jgi:hypothetical protein
MVLLMPRAASAPPESIYSLTPLRSAP